MKKKDYELNLARQGKIGYDKGYDVGYDVGYDRGSKLENTALGFGIFIGFLFTATIFAVALSEGAWTGEDELGQAICDQEHNMDFKRYDYEGLHCEPRIKEHQQSYDGIIINLEED